MELHVDALISALGGCGVAAAIAKYAITKALGDLDKLATKVADITTSLAGISVRLEKLSEHDITLKEHAKKLCHIESLDDARSQRSLQ